MDANPALDCPTATLRYFTLYYHLSAAAHSISETYTSKIVAETASPPRSFSLLQLLHTSVIDEA